MEYMSKKGSHLEALGWWVLSMVELAAAMTAMPSWEALAPESVLYVPPWPPSFLSGRGGLLGARHAALHSPFRTHRMSLSILTGPRPFNRVRGPPIHGRIQQHE